MGSVEDMDKIQGRRKDVKPGKKNIIFGSGDGFSLARPKQANTR